ncbi:UNVERIFIED_CONTAM: NAD(+) synthase [Campylobacter lari]
MQEKRISFDALENKTEALIKYKNYLVDFLKEVVYSAKCQGITLGISGGIDSAVCAALAKEAFPNNTLGIIMPVDDMEKDLNDIKKLSENIDLKFITVNLNEAFETLKKTYQGVGSKLALNNIKPRLRMITLYTYAQQNNYLVLGTGNADEMFIGYFTKYGDGAADILPICKLLKSEVRDLARILNIPESIINKKPSAGLYEGQSDEAEFGFTYNELDNYINFNFDVLNQETIDKIKALNNNTNHKRQLPIKPLEISEVCKEFIKK